MAQVLGEAGRVEAVRARFSALKRGFTFLDAPGGSQVPDEVGEAVARAMREASANMGGLRRGGAEAYRALIRSAPAPVSAPPAPEHPQPAEPQDRRARGGWHLLNPKEYGAIMKDFKVQT